MSAKYNFFDGEGKTQAEKVDDKIMFRIVHKETGKSTKLYYHLWDAVEAFENGEFENVFC